MNWLSSLEHSPTLLYGATVFFSLTVGSFLNVVIYRLPKMMEAEWRQQCADLLTQNEAARQESPLSLAHPRSHCPHCGHQVRVLENIPVLSYLLLRGRCSACGTRIGLRYPLVELATALLSVLVVWRFGLGWESAAALVLTWGLLALALIDLETQLLPDIISLPLLWLGLLLSLNNWFADSSAAILGAVLGYLSLWGFYHLFRLITGKEGMGYGDFKLFALFGAWLGWEHLPQILLLSACVGAAVGLGLIVLRGRDSQVPIPFGPYLAAAGWISLLWGDEINNAYLHWAGLV